MSSAERCTRRSRGHFPTAKPRGETLAGRRGRTVGVVASTSASKAFLSCPKSLDNQIRSLFHHRGSLTRVLGCQKIIKMKNRHQLVNFMDPRGLCGD